MDLTEVSDELKQRYIERIPNYQVIDGIIYYENVVTRESLKAIEDKEWDENDIVLACYPKAGTNWMLEVLSSICHDGDTDLLKTIPLAQRAFMMELNAIEFPEGHLLYGQNKPQFKTGRKRLWVTHLPLQHIPAKIREGKCKLLYMARNPKDQCVSFYVYHKMAKHYGLQTDLTFDEWLRLYCSGSICWGSYLENVRDYWRFTQNNPNAKFVFFEDMKKNLLEQLKDLEEFVGIPLNPELRPKVVEHCSFDSMKNNPMLNRKGSSMYDEKDGGKFIRKGEVGDWKNYFSDEQSAAFDEVYKKVMQGSGPQFNYEL